MGLFSKKGDGDDDSNRRALFGSRNKNKSPAPPTANPYATAPPDAYTQAKINAGLMPSPQNSSAQYSPSSGYGAPSPQQGYGATSPRQDYGSSQPQSGGYTANKFGNVTGYGGDGKGSNPYSTGGQYDSADRTGGYGGLGRTNSYDTTNTDANRDALFGGAAERIQQRQQNGPPGYEYNPASDPNEARSYGAYGDRQLTAEEEEEEDIQATKQDIRFMKREDVSSLQRALQAANQASETGTNTLARLGEQGERLYNTKANLNLAENNMKETQDRIKEINTYNRSLWKPAFTSSTKHKKNEEEMMAQHEQARAQREVDRNAAFNAQQDMQRKFQAINAVGQNNPQAKPKLADRAKYQFEADSEDEELENQIEDGLQQVSVGVQRLNLLSRNLGSEIESQNKVIGQIAEQSDRVDDEVHLQSARLKRIK